MENKKTVLAIDAGNTSVKVATFIQGEITQVQRFKTDDLSSIQEYYHSLNNPDVVLSSVLKKNQTAELFSLFQSCLLVDSTISLPISINYKTPNSLGIDRICNAVAAKNFATSGTSAVSIDVGTCLKFDFIDAQGNYFGGAISPGIDLRYKSLNDYTANLPLLDLRTEISLIGGSTQESIHSGVINGIKAEIIQIMDQYEQEKGDLTFFVTGGDAHFFDLARKNNIFVDENLTLKGLYQIYLFNAR